MPQIGPYKLANPVALAPMAGVTDLPFRRLCARMGAGLVVWIVTMQVWPNLPSDFMGLTACLVDPRVCGDFGAQQWNELIATARAERLIGALADRLDGRSVPDEVAAVLSDARIGAAQERPQRDSQRDEDDGDRDHRQQRRRRVGKPHRREGREHGGRPSGRPPRADGTWDREPEFISGEQGGAAPLQESSAIWRQDSRGNFKDRPPRSATG